MKIQIEITEQELKDLKAIRNYFGEHDKTMFEHKAYALLDRLVKLLAAPAVSVRVCYSPDCFYNDDTTNTCVGAYDTCTVKQTQR